MSERSDLEFLCDIKEAINRIKSYTKELEYKEFLKDNKTQDAVVRNLEIIGEATKNISRDFKRRYPDVPWKEMAGTRDKVIHFYFGVNYDIVWGISKDELPAVTKQVNKIIRSETK
jgi:uncharacterized protein with HEPN domain